MAKSLDVNWRQLGFEAVIIIVSVLAALALDDWRDALTKIYKCLSTGGRLILVDRASDGSVLTKSWGLIHGRLLRDDVRFYATSTLVELLKEAGFREVKLLRKIKKFLWKGKCYTSLAVLEASK